MVVLPICTVVCLRNVVIKEYGSPTNPFGNAVNFHNTNIYTIVPSGSNSVVLCPWMYLVFVLSTVLPSTYSLTNSDFMSCLEVIKG